MQAQIARRVQILLTLLILIAATYLAGVTWSFLSQFLSIFMLFFFAWLLAFLLKPMALNIARIGIPFGIASFLVYIIGPLLALLLGYLLVPAIIDQATQISSHLNEYSGKVGNLVDYAKGALTSLGVSSSDIQDAQNSIRNSAGSVGQEALQGITSSVGGISNELFRISLILVFSITILVDGDKLASKTMDSMPERWRGGASLIAKSMESSFGSFVRGQLFSALAYALLTALVMITFGLPDIAVSSLVAGLFIIVPLVGNYFAFVPPVIVCLVARPDQALVFFIVLAIAQGIYMNVISPRIMAKAVNMHPLVTTAAILVFGQLGGFWGAFFGIPIASTLGMLAPPTMQLLHNYLNPAAEPQPRSEHELAELIIPHDAISGANNVIVGAEETRGTSLPTPDMESAPQ